MCGDGPDVPPVQAVTVATLGQGRPEPAFPSADRVLAQPPTSFVTKSSSAAKAGSDRDCLPTDGRLTTDTPPTRSNPADAGIPMARQVGLEPPTS